MWAHPTPMFPVIDDGPFTKWGIEFTTCHPASARGHHYIIVAIDYFTKWVEAMPTFSNHGEIATLFISNQIVARFGISEEIVTNHGSHFQNKMMIELTSKIGFKQEHSPPYYLQVNGQVVAVNKSINTILRWTITSAKSNWHLMLYLALWSYQTSVKIVVVFLPFQLIYRMEAVLPIEFQIPSLKLVVELLSDTLPLEECLIYLEQLCDAALANEAYKKQVKCQYDRSICPQIFSENYLVLVYDQDKDLLGVGKFKPIWLIPFIVKEVLEKGAYHLVDFEGNALAEPRNGLYLKKYYS
jgi:hypothetical protein